MMKKFNDPTSKKKKKVVNSTIGKKSKSQTPPFLLNFNNFDHNVHNYLVDSRASSNFILYLMCKKLNSKPLKSSTHII